MNTNFKVIGLTRLGIKPESTAQETDASIPLGHLSCLLPQSLKTTLVKSDTMLQNLANVATFLQIRYTLRRYAMEMAPDTFYTVSYNNAMIMEI